DNYAVATGYPGKVIPITFGPAEGDIAVGEIEIQVAIVIQIAELRAEAPATQFHAHIPGQIFVLQGRPLLGHPEIVALDQHSLLGDVRDVDGILALVQDVSIGNVHPALGG